MAGLKGKALVAYLILCTVWGSTFLAIRVGVADIPPLLLAGTRFLIAGLILGTGAVLLGQALPRTRRDWETLAVSGILLLVSGNAVVVWAEQFVESGPASVYVAAGPIWTALFDTFVPRGTTRFSARLVGGLILGFLGAVLLAGATPSELLHTDLRGPIALTLASASWALGSVYLNRRPLTTTPYITAAGQMVIAGALMTAAGVATGQAADWHVASRSLAALGYLIVFGSIVGYTAYAFALKYASPTIVSTYSYANPVVAVLLGWLLLGEAVTPRTVMAMTLVLGAVLLIQFAPKRSTPEPVAASDQRQTTPT